MQNGSSALTFINSNKSKLIVQNFKNKSSWTSGANSYPPILEFENSLNKKITV